MTILTPKEVLQALADDTKLEYRDRDGVHDWLVFNPRSNSVTIEATLEGRFIFRSYQEMITIGDVRFPKPESKPLKYGDNYWIVDPTHSYYTLTYEWAGNELDESILAKGFLHKSRENAIAHAKALIELSGGKL